MHFCHQIKKSARAQRKGTGNIRAFSATSVKPLTTRKIFFTELRNALDPESPNFPQANLMRQESPDQEAAETHLTEVVKNPNDQRFADAKQKELSGIMQKNGFKIVKKSELPDDAVKLNGRLTITIKDPSAPEQLYKARRVVMGHADPGKKSMASEAPAMLRRSIRLMVALAAAFGFKMRARDVKQAYLQSMSDLLRNAHLLPPKHMSIGPDKMTKVIKPHCGMTEAGACWWKTFLCYHIKNLKMQQQALDPCFFCKKKDGRLQGMAGAIVGDALGAGNIELSDLEERESKKFEVKKRGSAAKLRFGGCDIEYFEQGNSRILSQQRLLTNSLTAPAKDQASFGLFRRLRGKLQWASAGARPGACFAAARSWRKLQKPILPRMILSY